jgi:hypothetical protein
MKMTPRELMLKPTGSRIEINSPSDSQLRFVHWLGYWPERIARPRQTLIKTLSPGFVFQAPPAEHAAYEALITA